MDSADRKKSKGVKRPDLLKKKKYLIILFILEISELDYQTCQIVHTIARERRDLLRFYQELQSKIVCDLHRKFIIQTLRIIIMNHNL